MSEGLDHAAPDQRPAAAAVGAVTALTAGDCLGPSTELALPAGAVALVAAQGSARALVDEALADADFDSFGDAFVGQGRFAFVGVGLEKDAGCPC